MIIPPKHISQFLNSHNDSVQTVLLKESHIYVPAQVATACFENQQNVYLAYYPQSRSLLIASIQDDNFKQIHKASQKMLKNRNAHGDKSVAIHDILIDHNINGEDRELEYAFQTELNILNIKL